MATQLKESGTHERAMQPFVISNNPENMAFIMFSLIPVFENKNAMPLKIKLYDKTSIKNVSVGCNKKLVLKNPKAGKWYISVFCETTVTADNGEYGVIYTGRTDVLNGVPYKIKVEFKQ